MKDFFKLDGKVAIVTGGAGGIGEALALGLGMHGATVVVSSRNREAIEKVAEKITAETGLSPRCLRANARAARAVSWAVRGSTTIHPVSPSISVMFARS